MAGDLGQLKSGEWDTAAALRRPAGRGLEANQPGSAGPRFEAVPAARRRCAPPRRPARARQDGDGNPLAARLADQPGTLSREVPRAGHVQGPAGGPGVRGVSRPPGVRRSSAPGGVQDSLPGPVRRAGKAPQRQPQSDRRRADAAPGPAGANRHAGGGGAAAAAAHGQRRHRPAGRLQAAETHRLRQLRRGLAGRGAGRRALSPSRSSSARSRPRRPSASCTPWS